MKTYEVECRAFVTKEKLEELREFLSAKAKDLGVDNKDTHFFILPEKLLKVVHNMSKNNAKIVLKSHALGGGHGAEEIEVKIDTEQVDDSVKLLKQLGFVKIVHSFQERHNFLYKNVEISLKHSEHWGYHVELEVMTDKEENQAKAEDEIRSVAEELGLKLLTNEETAAYAEKVIKAKATTS